MLHQHKHDLDEHESGQGLDEHGSSQGLAGQATRPNRDDHGSNPQETLNLPVITAEDEDAEGMEAYRNLEERRKQRRRKKRTKIIIAVCIAAAALLAIFLPGYLSSLSQPVAPTPTAVVERRDLTSTVSVSGSTQPVSSVVVTPEVDGIIQDLRVSEGDTVHKGDVLFTLKNDSLDRAVTEASTQVDSAQRQQKSAQSAYDRAYDAYKKALKAWNSAPTAEAQAAMVDPDTLYPDVESASDALETAKAGVQTAQQALDDAQSTASKRTVRAPMDGSVIAVGAKNGAAFGSAQGATGDATTTAPVQIGDLSQMRVTTQVSEVDISSLSVGQTASVTFSALPDLTLDATVERIATVSSSNDTGTYGGGYGGGLVTYKVTLLIPNPDPRLKPGMTANATIQTLNVPDSLVVPLGALQQDADGSYFVSVVTLGPDGNVESSEMRKVEVVQKSSSEAAVTGVNEGEQVELVSGDDEGSYAGDASASSEATGSDSAEASSDASTSEA